MMELDSMFAKINFGQVARVREEIVIAINLELLDAVPTLKKFHENWALALVGTGLLQRVRVCAHST